MINEMSKKYKFLKIYINSTSNSLKILKTFFMHCTFLFKIKLYTKIIFLLLKKIDSESKLSSLLCFLSNSNFFMCKF